MNTASARRALREHQLEAFHAATAGLAFLPRSTVIAACGSGKTLMAMHIVEHFIGTGTALILVPSLDLLAQTAHEWAQDSTVHNHIGVCSLQPKDLPGQLDQVLTLTTNPAELAALVEAAAPAVVFATYQSLPVLTAAHRRHDLPEWSIIVADEAHHTSGDVDKDWADVHDDARIPARRRLYMTATPRVWTNAKNKAALPRQRRGPTPFTSMDDTTVYGPVVYRLTLADAIERGLLADYRIVVPVIRDEGLRQVLNAEGPTPEFDGLRLSALGIALLQTMADYGVRRVITFHSRIVAARRFAASLPSVAATLSHATGAKRIWARAIDSRQSSHQRAHDLATFDVMPLLGAATEDTLYDCAVLCSVRTLGEGVDVPDADCVLFCDPKRSAVDIVQSLGRALRQPPGSGKIATLIVPVYLAPDETIQDAMQGSAFETLWEVLNGLREHDAKVYRRIASPILRRRHDDPALPEPERIPEIAPQLALRDHRIETGLWGEGFEAVIHFYETHGHLDIPTNYSDPDGFHLGCWIGQQRTQFAAGTLSVERIAFLTALDISWQHPPGSFEQLLEVAKAYATGPGLGSLAFNAHTPGADHQIGAWLTLMRRHADQGLLPPARVDALNAVDPWWNPPWSLRWQHTYVHLRHRLATREWTLSYQPHADADRTWNSWLDRQINQQLDLHPSQRTLLRILADRNPDAHPHMTLLNHRPTWRALQFAEGLRAARQYRQRHGHLIVHRNHMEPVGHTHIPLNAWLERRRRDAAQLTPQQLRALEALGLSVTPQFLEPALPDAA